MYVYMYVIYKTGKQKKIIREVSNSYCVTISRAFISNCSVGFISRSFRLCSLTRDILNSIYK